MTRDSASCGSPRSRGRAATPAARTLSPHAKCSRRTGGLPTGTSSASGRWAPAGAIDQTTELLRGDSMATLDTTTWEVTEIEPPVGDVARALGFGSHQVLLVRAPPAAELATFQPDFTVYHAPEMQADPAADGTRSGTFIVLDLAGRTALIGGTRYAGELKKSVFTILNYLLPRQGVRSMHCSANMGPAGDTALFFGLSGTGKTTLSADPDRSAIPLLHARTRIEDRATAYVCRGFACQRPVTAPAELVSQLTTEPAQAR